MNDFDLIVWRLDRRLPPPPLSSEPLLLAQGINPELRRRHADQIRYEARQARSSALYRLGD